MRGWRSAFLFGLVGVLIAPLIWWSWTPAALAARFGPEDCRRVALIDGATGAAIVGVEDIAIMPDGRLLLSAHDRLDPAQPDGGIYLMDPDRLASAEAVLTSQINPDQMGGTLRPHGLALSASGNFLALINRRRDGSVAIETLERSAAGWEPVATRVEEAFCRANDLAILGPDDAPTVQVSIDRGSCGMALMDLLPFSPTGYVEATTDTGRSRSGPLHFANGLADGWVAETRASRLAPIRYPGLVAHPFTPDIPLPGGPDNLTLAEDGAIVVALHPSLPRLGLYRFGWTNRAPSRVARVPLPDAEPEILFDDPGGLLFSGATVAVLQGNRLIAGSVRDAGLLLCEAA